MIVKVFLKSCVDARGTVSNNKMVSLWGCASASVLLDSAAEHGGHMM